MHYSSTQVPGSTPLCLTHCYTLTHKTYGICYKTHATLPMLPLACCYTT